MIILNKQNKLYLHYVHISYNLQAIEELILEPQNKNQVTKKIGMAEYQRKK